MRAGDFLTDIMRSLSFLSRIPVHDIFFENDDGAMGKTARAFPVAGALIALPAAVLVALLASLDADPLLAAAITLSIATVITGALHEDGLADTADGFGGGKTKESKLDIMKDSSIGTYGGIALILSFLVRVAAIAALIRDLSPLAVATCLIAAASLSRALMVWHWQALPSARTSGVAASVGQPGDDERNIALGSGALLALAFTLPVFSTAPLLVALAAPFVTAYLFGRLCTRKIDGHTGDTIGATQQITEIVILAALALIA
ncbi:adenosylcobinamide-GDP ribazoletransferase [Agrobacterium sp. rho-13.3]|uniref:adenosylcobinamide-GDP ribazoletransferase n=1 Tax=Agrobacterium sp. rho-13.3 TaxID=3072980 RepID=UPI002A0EB863|nr:adenosylcobinamide-GDP ribazoletransferase [Agrobacterium sp. rho-13.3]MDX8311343.1 adenosylcobinamide-GDP ribazoletransferase [Agrobacterium sp. rho-13.3]